MPHKTNTKLTREEIRCIKYNGAKESDLHDNIKSFIHERLQENENSNKGISNPEKEKRYKDLAISKQWKQPDIQSIYIDKNLVFDGDLFLAALKKHNRIDSIIEDDENGKLRIKIENYHRNRPQQNHDYDDLFKTIFPELFENNENGRVPFYT